MRPAQQQCLHVRRGLFRQDLGTSCVGKKTSRGAPHVLHTDHIQEPLLTQTVGEPSGWHSAVYPCNSFTAAPAVDASGHTAIAGVVDARGRLQALSLSPLHVRGLVWQAGSRRRTSMALRRKKRCTIGERLLSFAGGAHTAKKTMMGAATRARFALPVGTCKSIPRPLPSRRIRCTSSSRRRRTCGQTCGKRWR